MSTLPTTTGAHASDNPGRNDLAALTKQINREHQQCTDMADNMLQHAREAGRLLLEAKKRCGHGSWSAWLASNFCGSARTARWYVQIFRRWPELQAKRQRAANL